MQVARKVAQFGGRKELPRWQTMFNGGTAAERANDLIKFKN
jgi:hypothetical protein